MKIEANLLISKIKKDKFWIISYIVVLAVAVAYCLFNDENIFSNNKIFYLLIGYPKNFASKELHKAIVEFIDLYPEVNISIISGTHEELFEALVEQQLDIKISEQRRAFHDDYYNYVEVFS